MEPGPLLASGRDGDIFEFGPGRVLRKARDGRSLANEARIIEYVAAHGYPVPRIDELRANDTEIVMERIDGTLMIDAVSKDPRRLLAGATMLADLHDQLHSMPAPEWLRRLEPGAAILHLDLHPLNVMMDERGPVVIDWSNAHVGEPLADVASTYVLLLAPDAPVPRWQQVAIEPVRRLLARRFAARYRGPRFVEAVARAADRKQLDPHMSTTENARLARLAEKMRRRTAKAAG